MNKYLEGRAVRGRDQARPAQAHDRRRDRADACAARRSRTRACRRMLDAVIEFMPSPSTSRRSRASTTTASRHAQGRRRRAVLGAGVQDDDRPVRRQQLTFFRVYSGVLNSGDTVYNPIKGKKERIGRLLQMHANERDRDQGSARRRHRRGCVGLKDVTTGDTLCDPDKVITLEKMVFPEPVISQVRRAEDQGRPGEDGHRAGAWRRKTRRSACAPTRSRARPSSRHGRAAPRDHRRPHEARVQASRRTSASRRSPTARRSARHGRESRASSSSSRAAAASTATCG
jgi:hypothetical protein